MVGPGLHRRPRATGSRLLVSGACVLAAGLPLAATDPAGAAVRAVQATGTADPAALQESGESEEEEYVGFQLNKVRSYEAYLDRTSRWEDGFGAVPRGSC